MEIEIAKAESGDLDQLADMLAELFTLESDFRPDREKQLRGLSLILDNPMLGRLFVLRDQGRVAGMGHNLLWVTLGNTISGTLFMAAAYWFASGTSTATRAASVRGEVLLVDAEN